MTVENERDLEGLRAIGRLIALTLQAMARKVRAGITTAELDEVARALLEQHGARPAPQITYQFPGVACISLNEEAAHGIPGPRVIQPGDLVNIDLSAELDGYYADSALTVPVPPTTALQRKLLRCAQAAMYKGISAARAGQPLNAIGRAIEAEARHAGLSILRNLPGHGVGRGLHEEPSVPGFFSPQANQVLTEGLVITVEPFLSTRARYVVEAQDGWTLKTPDGSPSVQFEHTIIIQRGKPLILTAV